MRIYIAELLGTFALVFFGTGAIIVNSEYGGKLTELGIACSFGLVVMSVIFAFGDISGAHINPAVSIAFAVAGKFPLKRLPFYLLSQLAGALLGSLILKGLFPTDLFLGSTQPSGSPWQSFVLEFILSFFLMLVILRVSLGSKELGMFAGLAIGSVVGLEALFGGPISGASMNPARSLAPAIVSAHFSAIWVYLLGPVLGAISSVPVFTILEAGPKAGK